MLNSKKVPSNSGFKQPALEPGTYPVRLVQVISLGLQEQEPYEGKAKDPVYKIRVVYELLDEFVVNEEGEEDTSKPRWIGEEMAFHSLDSDLAKSTKRYYALDPEDTTEGDWSKLIGAPAMATIVKKKAKKSGNEYNKVSELSAMRPKEAKNAPELKNETKIFDLDEPDLDVFNSLPTFIQDKIKENLEFEGSKLQELLEDGDKKSTKKETKAQPQESDDEEDSDDEEEVW